MTLTRRLFARALTTAMLLGACPAWGAIGDDWANLAAYRQADVALTVGDADPNRIVFMGDSPMGTGSIEASLARPPGRCCCGFSRTSSHCTQVPWSF